jgi:hypothetical protein
VLDGVPQASQSTVVDADEPLAVTDLGDAVSLELGVREEDRRCPDAG